MSAKEIDGRNYWAWDGKSRLTMIQRVRAGHKRHGQEQLTGYRRGTGGSPPSTYLSRERARLHCSKDRGNRIRGRSIRWDNYWEQREDGAGLCGAYGLTGAPSSGSAADIVEGCSDGTVNIPRPAPQFNYFASR